MRLLELSSLLIADVGRKVRRAAIAGGILVVCALVVAIEGIAAARLALEPAVGLVPARLIIVAVFAVIGGAAVLGFVWADRRSSGSKTARDAHGEDPRAAIIAEAISLGYSLGRDFMKASPSETEGDDTSRKARANGAADERAPAA
jgi:hypothetical protein